MNSLNQRYLEDRDFFVILQSQLVALSSKSGGVKEHQKGIR